MTSSGSLLVTDARVMAIVQRLVNETRVALHAADSTVWLLDEPEAFLTPLSSARTPAALFPDMRTPVDDSVIGVVARTGMPTVIGPEDRHNPIAERVSGITTEWMVAAPVYVRGVLRGVLSAIQSDARRAFAGEDMDLVAWRAELLGYVLQVGLDTGEAS